MRYVIVFFVMFFSTLVKAQDIRSLFVSMPDSVSLLLTEVNRADFGDFLDSGMKAVVKNRFGNKSEMKKMTNDYIRLSMTSADEWEMKLLPLNDSVSVVCVVKTYLNPAHDSSIQFYDTKWNSLPKEKFVEMPDEADFFDPSLTAEQKDSVQMMKSGLSMLFVEMSLSQEAGTLTFRHCSSDYMDKNERMKFQRFLGKDIVYEWKNGKFVRKEAGQ